MNVPLYLVSKYLKNVTTNFDETLHGVLAYAGVGLCIVSAHITHKQKSFTNSGLRSSPLGEFFEKHQNVQSK